MASDRVVYPYAWPDGVIPATTDDVLAMQRRAFETAIQMTDDLDHYIFEGHGVFPMPPEFAQKAKAKMRADVRAFIESFQPHQKAMMVEWSTDFARQLRAIKTRDTSRFNEINRRVNAHATGSMDVSRAFDEFATWESVLRVDRVANESGHASAAPGVMRALWHRDGDLHAPLALPLGSVVFEGRGVEVPLSGKAAYRAADDYDASTIAVGTVFTRRRPTSISWHPLVTSFYVNQVAYDPVAARAAFTERKAHQPIVFVHRTAAPDVEAIDIASVELTGDRADWPPHMKWAGTGTDYMHELILAPFVTFHVVRDFVAIHPSNPGALVRVLETHMYPAGEECMLCANNRQPGKRVAAADEESKDDTDTGSSSNVKKKQKVTKARMRFHD